MKSSLSLIQSYNTLISPAQLHTNFDSQLYDNTEYVLSAYTVEKAFWKQSCWSLFIYSVNNTGPRTEPRRTHSDNYSICLSCKQIVIYWVRRILSYCMATKNNSVSYQFFKQNSWFTQSNVLLRSPESLIRHSCSSLKLIILVKNCG